MGLVVIEGEGDTDAGGMARCAEDAACIICQFAEELEEQAETFVEILREQAMEPRTAVALKALAGLILKGCES